ncbi:MAG: fibronectin type III domain-containing protein, partial [Acidimicrobiales bacterium]
MGTAPADKHLTRPGPALATVAVPHPFAGDPNDFSIEATLGKGATHPGAGPLSPIHLPTLPAQRPAGALPNATVANLTLAALRPTPVPASRSGAQSASSKHPSVVHTASGPTVPSTPGTAQVSQSPVDASMTWTAPSSNGGAAIDSYLVATYVYTNSTWTYQSSVMSCGSCTRAEVTGLVPDISYAWAVYAHNSVGYSAPSVTGGMADTALNQPWPGHPQIVGGAGGQLQVSWETPYASAAAGLTGFVVGIY